MYVRNRIRHVYVDRGCLGQEAGAWSLGGTGVKSVRHHLKDLISMDMLCLEQLHSLIGGYRTSVSAHLRDYTGTARSYIEPLGYGIQRDKYGRMDVT